ncbi:MAG: hypothetical protein EBT13_17760 [Rhodobacteraceae bacterium]|nr:hypothetical protein [Paracoccaceae bacterium]
MKQFFARFWNEEDGNATIDWMVLTAGLVLLGVAVMAAIGGPSRTLASGAAEVLDSVETGI